MQENTIKSPLMVGSVLFVLLAAYIYTALEILSPILIGILLLFVLSGLRSNPFVNRLNIAVWIFLLIWVFLKAQVVFFPFITSLVIAYILDPIADVLEKRKIRRTFASLILVLLFFGIIVTFGAVLIPKLVHEIQTFITSLPKVVESIQTIAHDKLPRVLQLFQIEETEFWNVTVPKGLQQIFTNLLKGVLTLTSFLGQLINIIIIPVLTFYILKDFNLIRQWFLSLYPKRRRPRISYYLWRINRIVGGYLRAQVVICIFVGFFTGLLLAFFAKVQFAVLLGVLAGLLNFIPYIGLYIGLTLTGFVAFLDPNPLWIFIKVLITYGIVQGIEGAIVQPKVVGDRVGLHPVAVMFSVLFFARFFGFWGLLIGVPTAAVVMFFIDEWKRKQTLMEMIEDRALKVKRDSVGR